MKRTILVSFALASLAACGAPSAEQSAMPMLPSESQAKTAHANPATQTQLKQLVNLDYSNGSITIFSVQDGKATVTKTFSPGGGIAQGLAMDSDGNIYTTITPSNSKPCTACVEVYANDGKFLKRLASPTLSGAPGPPSLTDVAVDSQKNVYVSDYGQQAVYYFMHARETAHGPYVVVQNSSNAASVLSAPSGKTVVVSGGCGFASVRPYTRLSRSKYSSGNCFSIGTIALIGGATDDDVDVMTPVDGVPNLVAVSSPSGNGSSFSTPDRLASISGVALNSDASVAYVADARTERVYAFARPSAGWLSSAKPKLLATYKNFSNLDIIAVQP